MMAKLRKIVQHVRKWYRGRYVPPPLFDSAFSLHFLSAGHYRQPPLAKALGVGGRFWLSHWKWIIGTLFAVTAATHMFR